MSSVKYFHSAMTGAPTLSGTAGTLIAVLDACLVNGFGLTTVDSIVVASGVATASMSLGHSFEPDTTALIAGSSTTALNGEKTVLTTTVNTVTFNVAGVADGTYTGAGVTAKLAPAGWGKAFAGTNVAAYRSEDIASTRMFLRVDDSTAQNARAIGYESMSDVNTGTGLFPTSTQRSGGMWWPNASTTATTPRPWVVVASAKTFYVWVNTGTGNTDADGLLYGFGDFTSFKAGDAYACFITGRVSNVVTSTTSSNETLSYSSAGGSSQPGEQWVARSYTAVGGSLNTGRFAESNSGVTGYSGSGGFQYPNPVNNALLLSRMLVTELTGPILRGVLPGLLFVPQTLGTSTFTNRNKIDGQGALAGRKLLALKNAGGPAAQSNTSSTSFIDITGPWE